MATVRVSIYILLPYGSRVKLIKEHQNAKRKKKKWKLLGAYVELKLRCFMNLEILQQY